MYVYILTNARRTVLYVGVTNDLDRRMEEHRSGQGSAFVRRYNLDRLAWFEEHQRPAHAIEAEKRVKSWRRDRKIALIEAMNPEWKDLSRWELE